MFYNSQKGVSLIITFFVMIIILSITLAISALLYSEVKIIRNMGDSVIAFYAADSGIEKVLYYDRQVLPSLSLGACSTGADCDSGQTCVNNFCTIPAKRGLCVMYDSMINPNAYCQPDPATFNPNIEYGIYCNPLSGFETPQIYNTELANNIDGCDASVCKNCQISFKTSFDDREYSVVAKVYPSATGESSNFQVESKGSFGSAQRQVRVLISAPEAESAIKILNACAIPVSTPVGAEIVISADVTSNIQGDPIGSVTAKIHNSSGNQYYDWKGVGTSGSSICTPGTDDCAVLPLDLDNSVPNSCGTSTTGSCYKYTWTAPNALDQSYLVDVEAKDTVLDSSDNPLNHKICKNLWRYDLCYGECK